MLKLVMKVFGVKDKGLDIASKIESAKKSDIIVNGTLDVIRATLDKEEDWFLCMTKDEKVCKNGLE